MAPLRLATRASPLALWQADYVAARLRATDPALEIEIVSTATLGDRRTDLPVSAIGGKGVFATEVQELVRSGDADIAVHSAKDLPAETVRDLVLAAVPERGDPRDALVGATLAELSAGDVVATGSRRRRVQLAGLVPGLAFAELRGNMHTRLSKAAGFDAIVVAAVALERLGLGDRITDVLSVDDVVPQVGQGALAVECRADAATTRDALAGIEHPPSRRLVDAERGFLAELGGDCDLPAGAHARLRDDGEIRLVAVLAPAEDAPVARDDRTGSDGPALGAAAARALRAATT